MGSIKDEVNKEVIKKAVSRNTVENVRAPEKQRNESSSSTNPTPNKIGAECSESGCSGVLMQSMDKYPEWATEKQKEGMKLISGIASVAVYKPWLYQCTACAKKFHLH